MNSLAKQVLDAHGGIDRWKQFRSVRARISSGGGLWALKGLVQDAAPRDLTVSLHEEFASISPYGQSDWRTAFTPNRIAIETMSGALVRERIDFLLRRHDYNVDIAGGFPAAQYVHDIVEVQGFRMPTKRRAYVRGPNREPVRDLLMVSIDFSDFEFVQ